MENPQIGKSHRTTKEQTKTRVHVHNTPRYTYIHVHCIYVCVCIYIYVCMYTHTENPPKKEAGLVLQVGAPHGVMLQLWELGLPASQSPT